MDTLTTKLFLNISDWADPWWWVSLSLCVFTLALVHPVPLTLSSQRDHDFQEQMALFIRKVAWGFIILLVLFLPILLYTSFGGFSITGHARNHKIFMDWCTNQLENYWMIPLTGLVLGVVSAVFWHRYVTPRMSQLFKKYRVKQSEDRVSDMRSDGTKYSVKSFNPKAHYKEGFYFIGLDENDEPVYIQDKAFHTTHTSVFGPTRFGKGVEFGVLVDQAIAKGNSLFFIDPKGDAFMPYIMAEGAKKAGKKFIYLDLNPDGMGYWEPFKGGEDRAKRARILSALKLEDGGSDADVYKSKERALVDKALAKTNGTITELFNFVDKASDADGLSKLRDSLAEWNLIKTFKPPKKNRGHSIATSIENGSIVYVRGSLDDEVIRLATRTYMAELLQEIKRLKDTKPTHITLCGDEIRFLMSKEVVDSLATVAGAGCNMILATQAITDLRNVSDATMDKEALASSFMINCQIKLFYRAGDDKTAEIGEKLSGTTWITQAQREATEFNKYGGEKWSNQRNMAKTEVPLIHRNTFLSLPPMVGVMFEPFSVPKVIFTSFVSIDTSVKSWEKAKPEMIEEPSEDMESGQEETLITVVMSVDKL